MKHKEIRLLSEYEVMEIIKSLNNKKTSGFDHINVALIKHISKILSPDLVKIINLSFCTGIFLETFMLSIVVPIHK